MDDACLNDVPPKAAENHPDLWAALFPWPKPAGHKYDRGHALIYGGAVMTGVARLAARAAQRMGAGLVTLAAPEAAAPLYASALESVIVRRADAPDEWRELLNDPKKNVVLIGPGAGVNDTTRSFVLEALATGKPCVLDADALTVFAGEPETLLKALHPGCVLTPHEGEFSRLFGAFFDQNETKIARFRAVIGRLQAALLLKGADTLIAAPCNPQVVINVNTPPWLATAGSGDVLAGMITGLLTAGMPPWAACGAASWAHGQIAYRFGPGLIAEDLVAGIPDMLKSLPHAAQ